MTRKPEPEAGRGSGHLLRLLSEVLGESPPVAVATWDGGRIGPEHPPATIEIRSPDAIARLVQAPGELGLARAYVAGDLDIEGDIFAALDLSEALAGVRPRARHWLEIAQLAGRSAWRRLPPPPGEFRPRGRRHSKQRDRAAVAHHYDVSNDFYRTILGPAMTYSCALWADPSVGLEAAQEAKHELICAKLGLEPGQRLLDVGCGWGTLAAHAASRHGVEVVGVTLSSRQVEWASKAVVDAGLAGSVEIRLQDYRDVADGPYDAISSVGMFEHVGLARMGEYCRRLYSLLRPGGRLLNHAISALPRRGGRAPGGIPSPVPGWARRRRSGFSRDSFIDHYVFPDGELIEVGRVVSALQEAGFEVRHLESLREHYGLTLRAWVANLEAGWERAVAAAGLARARTWRLYLAASALTFESGRTGIHQVLAVKPDRGRSGMPLRPSFT